MENEQLSRGDVAYLNRVATNMFEMSKRIGVETEEAKALIVCGHIIRAICVQVMYAKKENTDAIASGN